MYNKPVKAGINKRLFISILAATCLALLSMFFIMQWSINRGFLQYLDTLDQGRLERLSGRLERVYARHGSWDFLEENPRLWARRLMTGPPLGGMPGGPPPDQPEGADMPPPPPLRQRPGLRFIVLDAGRNVILGNPAAAGDASFKAIIYNGKDVGYVGLPSPKYFLNPPQLAFLEQQKFALVLAALGMVVAVGIFSFPLANRLVKPIRTMASATHDLASGEYDIRVPVSSSDELGQLAQDFNAMALALEKNEKARRQWVADISHELRTPLAVLQGETEALMEGIRSTTPERIRSLHAEVLRLHRLVDDLYQLALSDLGTLSYHKEELDLAGILEDSMESYRAQYMRKEITLTEDIAEEPEFVAFADGERLSQLFSNLLDNSLKYTDPGGSLVVRLSGGNGKAVIDFEDSAPGVHQNELARLFDRLYRVEGSRSRSSGGAGLGLAICRNIVEAHGGTITALPSPAGGVMMRIIMPVAGSRT